MDSRGNDERLLLLCQGLILAGVDQAGNGEIRGDSQSHKKPAAALRNSGIPQPHTVVEGACHPRNGLPQLEVPQPCLLPVSFTPVPAAAMGAFRFSFTERRWTFLRIWVGTRLELNP